jgi:hypothetical protein
MAKAAIEVQAGRNQHLVLESTQDFLGLLRAQPELKSSPQL